MESLFLTCQSLIFSLMNSQKPSLEQNVFKICILSVMLFGSLSFFGESYSDQRIQENLIQNDQEIDSLDARSRRALTSNYREALNYALEGLTKVRSKDYLIGEAQAHLNAGAAYYRLHKYDSAEIHLDLANKQFSLVHDTIGLVNGLFYLGDVALNRQNLDMAISLYEEAYELSKMAHYDAGQVSAAKHSGHVSFMREDYAEAMARYLQSLSLADDAGLSGEVALAKINVANVLGAKGDFTSAIQYLEDAASKFERLGDHYSLALCMNNIGVNLIEAGTPDLAQPYLDRALKGYMALNDLKGEAAVLTNLGVVAASAGRHAEAINYHLQALKINQALDDKYRMAECYTNISEGLRSQEKYAASISAAEQGLELANELNLEELKAELYHILADTYDNLGNYKNAYTYHRLYKQTNDSLTQLAQRKQVLELEGKYRSEQREKEIMQLTAENENKSMRIDKNRSSMISLIIILALILLLLLALYRFYQIRVKSAEIVEQKNLALETANTSLENSAAKLRGLNAEKDKFFTILAHDVRNPLNAFKSLTRHLETAFYDLGEETKLEYIQRISRSSESLAELVQNLLLWSTSQSGNLAFQPREVDVGVLAFKAGALLAEAASKKEIELNLLIDEETYAYADSNCVATVLINLVSNSIKFTPKGGSVTIRSISEEPYLRVSVEDTRVGISDSDKAKLFRLDVDHKTIGSSAEKGTGMGLILCKEFVEKCGGTITVASRLDRGSTFSFSLPLTRSLISGAS